MQHTTCPLRLEGETFCATCPIAPRLPLCLDPSMPHRVPKVAASTATRIGVFILSCIAFALLPVIFRDILTLRTGNLEGASSVNLRLLIMFVTVVAGTLTIIAAFYGLYSSIFKRDTDNIA